MRMFLSAAALSACLCPHIAIAAEDSLFSEIAVESVFEKELASDDEQASRGDGAMLERITGVNSLSLALTASGFTPKIEGAAVSIQVDHAGWKLPMTLAVEIEQDRIVCEVLLVKVEDKTQIKSDSLLNLLASGDPVRGAFFAYDDNKKFILLRSSFKNRGVTARQLKRDILQLGSMAEENANVWSKLAKKDQSATDVTTVPVASNKSTSATTVSLVGSWGATLSGGESIAILVTKESKFVLVHLKSGKSSQSKGTAVVSGDQLTLVGDDKVTLKGKVSQTSADNFQFTLLKDTGKPQATLNFRKAK
jgi:hypothetical protein